MRSDIVQRLTFQHLLIMILLNYTGNVEVAVLTTFASCMFNLHDNLISVGVVVVLFLLPDSLTRGLKDTSVIRLVT